MASKAKTVIDLLAEQPEEELLKMRDVNRREAGRVQDELSRLKVEGQQIEQALARRGRGSAAGRVTITREQVYEATTVVDQPMTAAAVKDALSQQGLDASINAIRNHLNRLVERGQLARREDGRYVLTQAREFVPASDDVPF